MTEVEEVSNESDGSASHWRMRRREASDDGEDDDVESEEEEESVGITRRRFEEEVESLGGAPSSSCSSEEDDDVDDVVGDLAVCVEEEEEAFVVPTSGSFYLHDDRFATSYGQCWNVYGGRGFKGVKEESKWTHDKFQEVSINDSKQNNLNVWRTGNGAHRLHGRGSGVFSARSDGLRVVKGRGPIRYAANMSGHYMNLPMRHNTSELLKQTVHSSVRVLPNAGMVRSNSHAFKKQYCASNENSVAQVHHYASSGAFSEPYFDPFQHRTNQITWPMYMTQYSQMTQVQPYFQQFGLHSNNGFPDLLEAISPSGITQTCRMHLSPGMQLWNMHNGGFVDHSTDAGSLKHMSQLGIGSEDHLIPWESLGLNYTKDGNSHVATGKANLKFGQQKMKPQRYSKMNFTV